MSEYHSEFEAPAHTTLDVRYIGQEVVRTVIFEGEVMEFIVSRNTYAAAQLISSDETNEQ